MPSRSALTLLLAALVTGCAGALMPGCYADWSFVRSARLQQQTHLERQLKALSEENAKLKQQQQEQAK